MDNQLTEDHQQNELTMRIRQRMNVEPGGLITFGQFMQMALYEPDLGYYQQAREKIGKQGDFYTSASIGGIMGEVLAMAFVSRMSEGFHTIVEWGAGNGRMARVILDSLKRMIPERYESIRYELVDASVDHRSRQRQELKEHQDRIVQWTPEQWWTSGTRERVIIWSNELLDAFPVERVRSRNGVYEQAYILWNTIESRFEWEWAEADVQLLDWLDEHYVHLIEGQIADLSLTARNWYVRMLEHVRSGTMIHIDYGHETDELFAAHRMNGTLLCYYQHQASDHPLQRIGEQDITAHVHMSAFQQCAQVAGWQTEPVRTQRAFLEREGVLHLLKEHLGGHPFDPVSKRNRAIRQLLWSDQMGDVFKVLEHKKE